MKKVIKFLFIIMILTSFSIEYNVNTPIQAVSEAVLLENSNLYANGNSISLEASADRTKYYIFDENHNILYEKPYSTWLVIYGGEKNKDVSGNFTITIVNVPFIRLYGGGYSNGLSSANVNGNIKINISGNVDANTMYGGGYAYFEKGNASANVNGNIDINISAIPQENHGNINGGGLAFGFNGYNAYSQVTGNTSTYVTGRTYSLRGGGSATTKTETEYANADVYGNIYNKANNVDIREVYGAGYASGHASANANNVQSEVIRNSEITILQGAGSASGNASANVNNSISNLQDCINIYGYVLGGGYACNGASATVNSINLTISDSIIPATTQFGEIVSAAINLGGKAHKATSDASVAKASLVVKNTSTCGTFYGGGESLEDGNAIVNNSTSSYQNLSGNLYKGNTYYSTIVAGGSYEDSDEWIEVKKSIHYRFRFYS